MQTTRKLSLFVFVVSQHSLPLGNALRVSRRKYKAFILNTPQCLLILEDLQSADQPFQTQQVIAVGRYIDLVEDNIRGSRRLGVALLFADYLLLRGL